MAGVRLARSATAVAVAVLLVAGCVGAVNRGGTGTGTSPRPTTTAADTPTATKHPKLDSTYLGLARASDRPAYASRNGLELTDGRVVALVELEAGRELPDGFGVHERARNRNLVRAEVPVDRLVALAEHENVSYVRRPPASAADT